MRLETRFLLLILLTYALILPAYVGLRFAGRWWDVDAARLTASSERVFEEGTLTPESEVYPHGYAYQTLNTFLAHSMGVSPGTIQRSVQPFLLVGVILVAFITYRAIAEDTYVALLATLLLCLQPEFTFEALRGSHTKLTYTLAFCLLLALVRSLRPASSGRWFGKWIALFYLIAFALVATNGFFASSYFVAIALAFLGGRVVVHLRGDLVMSGAARLGRLMYTALSGSLLVFVFMFYLYPPAGEALGLLRSVGDRIWAFILNLESGATPYGYIAAAWPSPVVYGILTMLNWVVLIASAMVWTGQAWALVSGRKGWIVVPWLPWLLYAAFAIILAFSVILDRLGAFSANLQVRLFPHLMVLAILLGAAAITQVVRRVLLWGNIARRLVVASLPIVIMVFAVASLIKVVNDPTVSRRWIFQTAGEEASVQWIPEHVHASQVWMGFDDRIGALVEKNSGWATSGLTALWGGYENARYVLASDVTQEWAASSEFVLPRTEQHLRIYDNHQVQLYQTRPQTPYQR